ncbi:MAG: LysR family transcriptional regulator [Bdellovibrionales bacterium]|nr:LysR family transcriptional regulator [Bdellovibrionales bacterium]
MIPSPAELSYFLEVAHTLNISRAAERLGISQPTLSIAIQRLEANLGLALLVRTKSGVKLTHAGRKLSHQVQGLVREWERIQSDALKDEEELRGRYTIGCHPSVALYALPLFLPKLMRENPDLQVRLTHDLSRKITEDVISFKIDFGIVVNPWEHPDLIIKPLVKDEVRLWTGPVTTPLNDSTSGQAVLLCDPDLAQTQSLLQQLHKKGRRFQRLLHSPNLEVIASLVAEGQGVGILPGRVASRVVSMKLKTIVESPRFIDKHCLVFRADAQKSRASRSIARFIEAEIKSACSGASR